MVTYITMHSYGYGQTHLCFSKLILNIKSGNMQSLNSAMMLILHMGRLRQKRPIAGAFQNFDGEGT